MERRFECVVVGLGPAGLAAAMELARNKVDVAVIDSQEAPGGQIYRQPPKEFHFKQDVGKGARQAAGQQLIQRFSSLAEKMTVFTGTLIWGATGNRELYCLQNGSLLRIGFQELIIAEGARERSIPFPGWTLPGVMTAGGLQKMISNQHLLPGKRFLLAGSGPLQIATAAMILAAGGQLLAIIESSPLKAAFTLLLELLKHKIIAKEGVSYVLRILKHRVPLLHPYAPVEAKGNDCLEELTVARLDDNGLPIKGTEKTYRTDVLGLGFGVQPASKLTRLLGCDHEYDTILKSWKPVTDRQLRASIDHVRIAGDSAGIGGADLAEIEGALAGTYVAYILGKITKAEKNQRCAELQTTMEKLHRYIRKLDLVFRPADGWFRWMDGQTVVCRCEWVSAQKIHSAIDAGCREINEMKRRTGIAMGMCQGGTCEAVVTEMMRQRGIPLEQIGRLHIRPPAAPIPLSAFHER